MCESSTKTTKTATHHDDIEDKGGLSSSLTRPRLRRNTGDVCPSECENRSWELPLVPLGVLVGSRRNWRVQDEEIKGCLVLFP